MTTENLLKKINFIEADMEIQRQILHSLPSDNEKDITAVLQTIADYKTQIQALREELQKIDPDEYQRILAYETSAAAFKDLVRTKQIASLTSRGETGECAITLTNDTKVECLVKAREENGDWVVFTMEGEVLEFPKDNVLI